MLRMVNSSRLSTQVGRLAPRPLSSMYIQVTHRPAEFIPNAADEFDPYYPRLTRSVHKTLQASVLSAIRDSVRRSVVYS